MAEKKVSVRLSAEGGRQVRAEMAGIGKAGTQAFGQVTLAQKSAADSAAVFTAALNREDQAFRDLRASLDPGLCGDERYEAAVEQATRAVRAGVWPAGGGQQRHRDGAGTPRHVRRDCGFGRAWSQRLAGPDPETRPSSCRTSPCRFREGRRPRPRWRCSCPSSRRVWRHRRGDRRGRRHRHPAPDHRHAGQRR